MNIIIANSIVYWITAIIAYRKKGVTLYSFLWFYYALFSFFSILLMRDGLYFEMSGESVMTPISYTPYIILYFSFILITRPLRNFNFNQVSVNLNLYHYKKFRNFVGFANFLSILYVFIKLIQIYLVAQVGFGIVHDMEDASEVMYPGVLGVFLRPINLICRINNIVIMPMVVLFFLYGYVKKLFRIKKTLKVVLPYCLGTILMGFVGGSRAAIFFGILQVLFFYVLFQKYIPSYVKKRILIFSVILSILILNVTLSVTRERFGDAASFAVENSILDYLGQMFPNVNYRIWEHDFEHPMGKRLFPLLCGGMGLDNDYFATRYNVTPWIFHTMWGGLYEDLGLVLSMVFIVFLYLIMERYMKRGIFKLEDISFCLLIYYIGYTALFDYHLGFVYYISLILLIITRVIFKRIKWNTN